MMAVLTSSMYMNLCFNVDVVVGIDLNVRDVDANGTIGAADKTIWAGQAGTTGYKSGDLDMDTQVDNVDKNDVYVGNSGSSSQVQD
jgi:hypothetical protein